MLVKVLKDFLMEEDHAVAFKAGEEYAFAYEEGFEELWSTVDEQGDYHIMDRSDMLQLNPEFDK